LTNIKYPLKFQREIQEISSCSWFSQTVLIYSVSGY